MIPMIDLLNNYGYISLFLTSFLASTVLPFGSEGLVALLVVKNFNIPTVVLVATIGNFLGACTSYYLGLVGRIHIITKYLGMSSSQIMKAENIFNKYGSFSLLFTWVPGIGDVITVVGGLLRYKFSSFVILVFVGKLARYIAVAYIFCKL